VTGAAAGTTAVHQHRSCTLLLAARGSTPLINKKHCQCSAVCLCSAGWQTATEPARS
jgi:hypothetical protein